jgi:hypothetical protein
MHEILHLIKTISRGHLENTGTDVRITLKYILDKLVGGLERNG